MARVGVLALQGGYAAHVDALKSIGCEAVLVRYAEQLDTLEGLILPGGESTTHLKILAREALGDPLDTFVRSGRPVLATCAGLILAAREVTSPEQKSFAWLDVCVQRNGWGRQLDSFEAFSDDGTLPLLFIRAPRITQVGTTTEVLATYENEPVFVRQGSFYGATFHPELTRDPQVHQRVFGEL